MVLVELFHVLGGRLLLGGQHFLLAELQPFAAIPVLPGFVHQLRRVEYVQWLQWNLW